jgi:hypothetical protein
MEVLPLFLWLDGCRAKYDASLYLVDDSVRAIRKSVHSLDYDEDDAANLTAVSSMSGRIVCKSIGEKLEFTDSCLLRHFLSV